MTPPRVLLVGTDFAGGQTDTWWQRAFLQEGCAVSLFDYRETRVIPGWLKRLVPATLRHTLSPRRVGSIEHVDSLKSNRRFMDCLRLKRPQLIFALQAERLNAEAIQAARSAGAVTVNWMTDDPWRVIPESVVAAYDIWAVFDLSYRDWLLQHGARRIEHLPMACDPQMHHPVRLSNAAFKRLKSSICFVGGFAPVRQEMMRAVADLGLGIWGPGWRQATDKAVRACVREGRLLKRQEWLQVYSAADIVLNVHAQGKEGLNARTWEALACETCLVSDERADIAKMLPGIVATFSNPQQLRKRCEELLQDEAKRQLLAVSSRRLVLEKHTYRHRVRTVLQWTGFGS